ncbi:MAG: TonB-dependent receptor [Prevotellaceae bacterium]|jgi:TonB-linked SusC/RagA family outer membrane protein|nr:TonB-dependent receptor [Prevotellaceae bacterium]
MERKAKRTGCLKQTLFISALLCFSCGLYAQQITVNGTVADETNFPLPGVNVVVKNTTVRAISDLNGKFTLNVSDKDAVLRFTYLGFTTLEIPLNGRSNLAVTMTESIQNLDEVVVVGYGVQKKSHLTGSISKYRDDNLGDLAVSRLDQALQGKIAGVTVQNTTTEAGAAPQIRVRGMGSISASNEPLVVVDGFPMADGLAFVDMNDVESIEVLKDAASAAIYGSRGANGVIIVTTKSADIAKPKYTVKGYTGIKTVYKYHDIASARDYVNMLFNEQEKGGTAPTKTEKSWLGIDNYTDWQREGTRSIADINNVQLSISGGKKEAKYYISGSYTSEEGIMINSRYDKFNVRAKLDATLSPKVEAGINIAPAYSKREAPATNFIDFYRTYTWLPVRHTATTAAITGRQIGEYAHGRHFNNKDYYYINPITGEEEIADNTSPWGTNNNNPRSIMDNESRFTDDYRLNTSAYLNIKLAEGLTFKTTNGFFVRYQAQEIYHNANAKSDGDTNFGRYTNMFLVDLLSENILDYNRTFAQHSIGAMLGYTANQTSIKRAGIYGTGFPNDYINTINAATSVSLYDPDGNRVTQTYHEKEMLLSYLGRLTYSYDDKYLFSGSLRTDGSSRFGPDNQWAWFPSVSLGWRLSEEEFVKKIVTMDQLKFRASWGLTGNYDIENYAAYDKLQNANYVFGTGTTLTSGLVNTSNVLGNKAITWEQTNEYNIGFDLSIVKSRVNLTADYYYAITKSLLFKQPVMAITGYSEYWNNIGRVRNKGIELELNTYNIKNKNFEWQTTVNFATNDNLLLELADELAAEGELKSFGEREEIYVARVGGPAIQFYGYQTDGVWLSQQDITDSGLTFSTGKTVMPGTLKVVNQNDDNKIDIYDRVVLGNPFPDFTWGMTNSFKIKKFDVSVLLQGVQGVTVLNGDGYYQETKKINRAYTNNRYISPEHPGDGKTPTFAGGNGIEWELTDYLLEDGSYAALRDVTVGYMFDKKLVKKIGVNNIRLYVSGQNLFYIWSKDYRGINPEARYTSSKYSSPLIDGYQRGAFPMQRTFSVGGSVTF